ncbi:MAG: serine hydrolase domain-containing protein [Bacteroidota bacterium]|jgi:CubicO group peptidase (beta-lactamase class C family)
MMKKLKKIGIGLLILICVGEISLWASGNLYVNKVLALTIFSGKLGPDIYELNAFDYKTIAASKPEPWSDISAEKKYILPDTSLAAFKLYETDYFLVIQNNQILYEYADETKFTAAKAEPVNSFSMAKSFTSLLIGCALKDGYIQSLDDATALYIPELRNDARGKITIRQLLTMSSGLAFDENYASPFSWPARAYYGDDVNSLTLTGELTDTPGVRWNYKGGDTQLLGMILKNATHKSVAAYASERLWQPMGAEYPAYWSTDEKGMEKVSCCWYSHARDFARFGRLMMQYGNWNGIQLIDSAYIVESIMPASILDENNKPNDKYGYQWWLMTHQNHRIFYARGIRGQYIFCVPDMNMIVVRLGHKRASKTGHNVPADVFTYLDVAFACAEN